MRTVDGDADDKLTRVEFTLFLSNLKLSTKDVGALCRIAGYTNGKTLLGIEEWVQILQDRPK
jgi:hypothetical protein